MQQLRTLVVSGGGVRGISLLGALDYLETHAFLDVSRITTFAGTSVGAVICALLVAGYGVREVLEEATGVRLGELIDADVRRLGTHFGLVSGRGVVRRLEQLLVARGFARSVTLGQLHGLTGKTLVVAVTKLGHGVVYLSHANEPALPVAIALRMSFAVPFLFSAVRYNGALYVDGGVLNNFPVAAVRREGPVLGIRLAHPDVECCDLETFAWSLLSTVHDQVERCVGGEADARDVGDAVGCVFAVAVPADQEISSALEPTDADRARLSGIGWNAALRWCGGVEYLCMGMRLLPRDVVARIRRLVDAPEERTSSDD